MVQGHCSHDFRDQGRASGGRLRGRRRVVRRATGPALPTRRAKPRRVTEQGGRDLKQTLEFDFSFFGGGALLAASSLGLAMARAVVRRSLLRQDVIRCEFHSLSAFIWRRVFSSSANNNENAGGRWLRDRSRSCLKGGSKSHHQ